MSITSATAMYSARAMFFLGFFISSAVLVIKPKPWYPKNNNADAVNILLTWGNCEIVNKEGFIKNNPTNAKTISIPTFIPTIIISDLPTTLGPKKLMPVKIRIIRIARIVTESPDWPMGRCV